MTQLSLTHFTSEKTEVKAVGKPSKFKIITLHTNGGKLMLVWEVMMTRMLNPRKAGGSAQTLR